MANDWFYVKGIDPPVDVKYLTERLPYATGLPQRREISRWFEEVISPKTDAKKKAVLQKQWTSFVLGLEQFKSLPVDEKLSYFQIAGIHGYPQLPWDGAPPPPPDPDPTIPRDKRVPGLQPFGGYCHHNTIAFPAWHRPYMLLFEQVVWINMKKIVQSWDLEKTESDLWLDAASTWRLPYWDWGQRQNYPDDPQNQWNDFGVPYLFSVPNVPIFPPPSLKIRTLYPNPLWYFENPEKDENNKPLPMGSMPKGKEKYKIEDNTTDEEHLLWSRCSGTSRWGIVGLGTYGDWKYSGFEGVNAFQKTNLALSTMARSEQFIPRWYNPRHDIDKDLWNNEYAPGNIADALNRMFSSGYNGTWAAFASTKWFAESKVPMRTGFLSLEGIHNNIHNICGGSSAYANPNRDKDIIGLGHMSDVPVAAFDPIFWMHHGNIDRLMAMWQILNWEKWWDQAEDQTSVPNPWYPDDRREDFPAPVPDIPHDGDLRPFHTEGDPFDKETFWTPDQARDWTKLHYCYDDLQHIADACATLPGGKLDEKAYITMLRLYIHQIYPGTSYSAYEIRKNDQILNSKFFGAKIDEDKAWFQDYLINVVYDRYATRGSSYAIKFYLVQDPSNKTTDMKDLVGQIYSLGGLPIATRDQSGCANCGSQNDGRALSRSQVPLTIPVINLAADQNFSAITTVQQGDVTKFLKEHLRWQFVTTGGAGKEARDFPRTSISIWGGIGRARKDKDNGEDVWFPPLYETETYRVLLEANENTKFELKEPNLQADLGASMPTSSLEEMGSKGEAKAA